MWQLRDFDMCIVKNEEAIRIEPQFAECYGNMANALKVHILNSYGKWMLHADAALWHVYFSYGLVKPQS